MFITYTRIINKTVLVLLSTVFLSSLSLILYNFPNIDHESNFYDYYKYFITPMIISLSVVIYCIVNNYIFKIFNNRYLYLYVFGATFLLQILINSLGYFFYYGFLLVIPMCQGLYFFIEYKKRLLIFISNSIVFFLIILFSFYVDLFKNYDMLFTAFILSYFGIFHFLYILLNIKTFAKTEKMNP
jgi:hypothetical protein